MRTRHVFFAYIFIILGLISKAENQSPTDSEFLIAGLQHAESLIVSGKGEVHIQMVRNKGSEGAIFAFNQESVYMDYQIGALRGVRCIYNGASELSIGQDPDKSDKIIGIVLTDRKTVIPQEDPRNWGIQFEDLPLSQYLQKHGVRILGSENLKNQPCFVVESEHRNGQPIKFWISQNGGFRCLKIQHESSWQGPGVTKAIPSVVSFEIEYKAYQTHGQKAHFPLKGVRTARAKLDNEFLGQVVLNVKNFELNIDVSNLFQEIHVDPEFPVWIERLEKSVPFKEINWRP